MLKNNLILVVASTLLLGGIAQAAIYKSTDAHGNVVYSDSPTKDAKAIELPPLAIVPSLSAEQMAQANAMKAKTPLVQNYQLGFAQPANEQTVRKPDSITVQLNVAPALINGDQVTILLDGIVVANGSAATIATENLDRGAHSISARITDAKGKVLKEASTTVTVQQTSQNSPANQANKPKPIPAKR